MQKGTTSFIWIYVHMTLSSGFMCIKYEGGDILTLIMLHMYNDPVTIPTKLISLQPFTAAHNSLAPLQCTWGVQ